MRKTVFAFVLACAAGFAAGPKSQAGATLAGYKTIDICSVDNSTWRYSGVISVWNESSIDTVGLNISDLIEYKTGTKWVTAFSVPVAFSGEIPAGTTQLTALTFPYSIDAAALPGTIRNNVSITILNHSTSLGTPFGPNPKATYTGSMPPPACIQPLPGGCVYGQGYWGSKPDVVWPDGYTKDAAFFMSGQTWQQVMDTPANVSQGYYQLAYQYIAAVLNEANGAPVPQSVQDTLSLASNWLTNNAPSACTANGSCGAQKDWAATLNSYNAGTYPGGPSSCEVN